MLYNVCTGVFTALGDSKTPLYFLLGSSAGNIVLDLIFVAQFHWGVAGVAWDFHCTGICRTRIGCAVFPDSGLCRRRKTALFDRGYFYPDI